MRICIICASPNSVGQWYRGPRCNSCYHKNHYKSEQRKFGLGQKFSRGRSNAKRRSIEWELSKEEYRIKIERGCFYCGKSLFDETGCSLDKIDGSQGYTALNTVPCCGNCNTIKNSILTLHETIEVIELIKRLRNTTGSPWARHFKLHRKCDEPIQ